MKKSDRSSYSDITLIALLSLVVGFILYSVISSYNSTYTMNKKNNNKRAVNSYLVSVIQNHDYLNGVYFDTNTLILKEYYQQEEYEIRIYCDNGYLKEKYMVSLYEDSGQEVIIAKNSKLEIKTINTDLLEIVTDEGTILVRVASGCNSL